MRVQEESSEYKSKLMREASSFVLILTTWPADRDATGFSRALVDERLAACVSVLEPMVSTYRWQGTVEESRERQVIIKTIVANVDAVAERLSTLHPYEVPEVLVLPITHGGEKYLAWIAESLGRV